MIVHYLRGPADTASSLSCCCQARNRLDFTCIGPAVNCAARIEKLTGQLGRAILASDEFARYCPGEFTALGEFSLAGFSAPQLIYDLADSV
jgi:adenylate cyclase